MSILSKLADAAGAAAGAVKKAAVKTKDLVVENPKSALGVAVVGGAVVAVYGVPLATLTAVGAILGNIATTVATITGSATMAQIAGGIGAVGAAVAAGYAMVKPKEPEVKEEEPKEDDK